MIPLFFFFFFFNDTATTEIYTLSLHDALPICLPRLLERRARHSGRGERDQGREPGVPAVRVAVQVRPRRHLRARRAAVGDRKSTRLNSSHSQISYAVFCLKKKKKHKPNTRTQL